MPFKNHKGEIEFEEVSIYDTRADLDRGPNSQCQMSVFEVKTTNRMFTLYSEDNKSMELFVVYFEKILKLKEQMHKIQK